MKIVSSREEFLREVKTNLPKKLAAVELGVFNGDFSQIILNILRPRILHLIDPFEVNNQMYDGETSLTTAYSTNKEYKEVLNKFELDITVFKNISVNRKYSYEAVKDYRDNYFDFIYIDACHLYECVKQDLNDWLPKLKKDGLMCGHDYVNIDNFGVIKAVDEFCIEHNFEMIIFNENGGDWALKRKN